MTEPSEPELRETFTAIIEEELAQLDAMSQSGREDRKPVELDQQSTGRVSRIDSLQVQAMAKASDRRRQARKGLLRAALERLKEGEFGWCEACGAFIGEKRLKIDPATRYCIACASGGD